MQADAEHAENADVIPVRENQPTLSLLSNEWGVVVVRIALLVLETAFAIVRIAPPPF